MKIPSSNYFQFIGIKKISSWSGSEFHKFTFIFQHYCCHKQAIMKHFHFNFSLLSVNKLSTTLIYLNFNPNGAHSPLVLLFLLTPLFEVW